MFELKDGHTGEPLFETIQISLVCDDCMKTDHPELCTHKLAEMPRWLSSSKMEVVKSLLADDPAMLYAPRPPTPWDRTLPGPERRARATERVDPDL